MSQHLLFTSTPYSIPTAGALRTPNLSHPIISGHLLYHRNFHFKPLNSNHLPIFSLKPSDFHLDAYLSDDAVQATSSGVGFNLDSILSAAELLCIISAGIGTASHAVNSAVLSSKKAAVGTIGSSGTFGWGLAAIIGGVAIGVWIRRRQWRRLCVEAVGDGREGVNLVERIEKLEEDLRSSVTIIRALSRRLEKLGIRFRVTRRSLKGPIAETAALVQNNSEATRALALQEDILEKELVEIQKVLLAMQEQQQKQLELIFAIGKIGKLWENRSQEQEGIGKSDSTDRTNTV